MGNLHQRHPVVQRGPDGGLGEAAGGGRRRPRRDRPDGCHSAGRDARRMEDAPLFKLKAATLGLELSECDCAGPAWPWPQACRIYQRAATSPAAL